MVSDVVTGKNTRYLLSLKSDSKKWLEVGARSHEGWPDAAAFEAFVKANAVALKVSRSSADGKLKAAATVKPGSGRWEKDSFEFQGDEGGSAPRSTITLYVTRAERRSPSFVWQGEGPGGGALSGNVRPIWSPDGARVAWVIHRNAGMLRDREETFVRLGPAGGPRVELALAKALDAVAAARVREALGMKNFVVVKESPALKAREVSVVYGAKGFEDDAKAIAALVPGGATVEPLSWKTDAEVVVAVGQSAAGK